MAIPALVSARGWQTAAEPAAGIAPFTHTGTILLASALLAAVLYHRAGLLSRGSLRRLLRDTVQRGRRSALGILTMMMMALVMANAGMTRALAEGPEPRRAGRIVTAWWLRPSAPSARS